MRPDLGNPPAVKDNNLGSCPHCAQPVRNDAHRPIVSHKRVQRVLDERLRVCVLRTRRLVQQQDLRVEQHRPSNGNPLLLPARQPDAPLAHSGFVLLREPHDKVVRVGLSRRIDNLVQRRARLGVRNVFPDRAGKQDGLLRDRRHPRPEPL